jgi:hypothetical protein
MNTDVSMRHELHDHQSRFGFECLESRFLLGGCDTMHDAMLRRW